MCSKQITLNLRNRKNKVEINNLPDNEFKLGIRMDEHSEKFSKKLEDIKK